MPRCGDVALTVTPPVAVRRSRQPPSSADALVPAEQSPLRHAVGMDDLRHRQQRIFWDGDAADVDEGIADFILECWKAGCLTGMSCQGEPGESPVWVMFLDAGMAEQFLNIVCAFEEDTESIWNRAAHDHEPDDDWEAFRAERAWRYDVVVDDWAEQATGVPRQFELAISVRFPHSDLDVVLERLRRHNENQHA